MALQTALGAPDSFSISHEFIIAALILEQVVAEVSEPDKYNIARAFDEIAPYYGPESKAGMWEEQSSQWDRLDKQLARLAQGRIASPHYNEA